MSTRKIALAAILGLTALPMISAAASADPITLICRFGRIGDSIVEDEPTTIDLNEAQASVVVHFGLNHYTFPQFIQEKPISTGPLAAVFGAETITFSAPSGTGYPGDYVLNRLTGDLVNTNTNWRYACQPARKQF